MFLYYDDFKEQSLHSARLLAKLKEDDIKCFVHEMKINDIKIFLGSEGRRGFESKKCALLDYLQWLFNTHNIDTVNLYQEVRCVTSKDINFEPFYFYSLQEFHRELDKAIESAYISSEASGENRDFDGFKAFCLCQWYGVTIDEFVSIHLYDVKGNEIYIPLTDRKIIVDDKTSEIINEYKNKIGIIITRGHMEYLRKYKQNTLYRTISNSDVTKKTIENIRAIFIMHYKDSRFAKGRIFYSGRYEKLLEIENQLNRDLTLEDVDIVKQVFRRENIAIRVVIQDYEKYKEYRENWLLQNN